ncbi:hypothetical protein BGZ76_007308 [Entomortierella beljakovae]|nr:hypothetical protein BGZ76_007308 [Entomortierella beljakovae]
MATKLLLKKVQIDPFTGTSFDEQISLWLRSLEDFYDAHETSADERLTATPLLFQKTAKLWWQGLRDDFHAHNGTWTHLKQALITRFEDPNHIQNARDALARLRQVTSVAKYIEEFNVLRVRAGNISEPEAIQRFRDGLKPMLQQHFRGNPDHCQELGQMQRIAGSLDHARFLFNKPPHHHRPQNHHQPSRHHSLSSYSGSNNTPQPMELDTMTMGHHSSTIHNDPVKQEDYRAGNCFYCHERGHRAKECPRKRLGKARS